MSNPPPHEPQPHEIARQATDALGEVFDDEGPYSVETTKAALTALATCAMYLKVCMGAAQPATIRDLDDLREVLLSLNATTVALNHGLTALLDPIDRRTLPGPDALDITAVATMRAAIARATDGLRACVNGLADAHATTTTTTAATAATAATGRLTAVIPPAHA
jgi:hypothetical protein